MNATRDAWIGLGFDPVDSGMDQADMAILTKSNSTPSTFTVQDRWSAISPPPKVDNIQNFEATAGGTLTQNTTVITWMTFTRALDTKDTAEDKIIRQGPLGTVWAVGTSWDFGYHGVNRGFQMLTLLSPLQDCVYNPWSNWTDCSGTCTSAIQTRSRSSIQPRRGGAPCQGPVSENTPCALPGCSTRPDPAPVESPAPASSTGLATGNMTNITNPAPSNTTVVNIGGVNVMSFGLLLLAWMSPNKIL